MSALPDTLPSQFHEQTSCCIVGGGPAGMILSFLLARQGVAVRLLELHQDFDREFRGDTLLPSSLEVFDQMGFAERILSLPHSRIDGISLMLPSGPLMIADFRRLHTRFPFMAVLPQTHLLEFFAREAQRLDNFELTRGANAFELLKDGGAVTGVRYRTEHGIHSIQANLVVGADGRSSRVRKLAGLEPKSTSAPLDLLWLRLARNPVKEDGKILGAASRSVLILPVHAAGRNHFLILLDCKDYWQVGYVVPPGGYSAIRAAGLTVFQKTIADAIPEFDDRVQELREWRQISRLTVQPNRVRRWHQEGLLLIGDAAHVMSPLGGVGINYAIQDAVVTSRLLAQTLISGSPGISSLAAVQGKREWPTRVIQTLQALEQRLITQPALDSTTPYVLPSFFNVLLRNSLVRAFLTHIIGRGMWSVQA